MANGRICPLSMAGPTLRECGNSCEFCPPADWAEIGNIWTDVHQVAAEGLAAEVTLRGSDRAIPAVVTVTDVSRVSRDGGR